jgi:hypothetical protein
MSVIHITPKTAPKCPNHGCPLEGCGFPLPAKGEGICPVSKAHFEFQVDGSEEDEEMKVDKDGVPYKEPKWKVIGDDK